MREKLPELPNLLLATIFGFVRSSAYYQVIRRAKDNLLAEQIRSCIGENPSYGYRRVALALGIGKKQVQRVMALYKIRPYKRKARWRKRRDERRKPALFANQIKNQCPLTPNHTWVGDFTYLPFHKKFLYLATFMDLYTREIVGWHISNKHTKHLVMEAFLDGLVNQKMQRPKYVHTDQGAEYTAEDYTDLVKNFGIQVSMSTKASPWENGYQESFYNNFKTDLGLEFDRFSDTGQMAEAIHQQINYYNKQRIHTSLRMSPEQFRRRYKLQDFLSKERGAWQDVFSFKDQLQTLCSQYIAQPLHSEWSFLKSILLEIRDHPRI